MLTAIIGVNWGDEGKGRMVDLLSEQYDIVVRYQGGNNAGHTVINEKGKFILNLLPSGILRETTVNVMGNGMVIALEHLVHEIENLRRGGIAISPENLKISERAVICMPYHKLLDCYEEDRLADAKYGSTRRGIAPVYGDKYMKKALRMGDLFHPETTKARLADIVAYKNLTIEGVYGRPPVSADDMWAWLVEYGDILKPYICDAGLYLDKAAKAEAADRERRERMAALSQRLTALTEKRRQLSSHMDFYRRSLLKGNPSASSSRFSEALKELRENAGRRQKDGDGKPETMD